MYVFCNSMIIQHFYWTIAKKAGELGGVINTILVDRGQRSHC